MKNKFIVSFMLSH